MSLPALDCNIVHFMLALAAFNLGVHYVHWIDNTPACYTRRTSTKHQSKHLVVRCDLFLILNPKLCLAELISPEVYGPTRNRAQD
jgi:hypothetical protein